MSATPNRRTQEERSSITQQKLAEAAFNLIREKGYANFRVASVAKEAGVSQGGQLHHFPTKDLMTMAAIEHAIGAARLNTIQNLERYTESQEIISAITTDCRDYYFSANFDVAMDVAKGASDNPELRRQIARQHRIFRSYAEDGWLGILVDQGWAADDAKDMIAMTASLVRGFAIRSMLKAGNKEIDRLMTLWQQMVHESFG
jgi:AcrR family transcriptional regulator